MKVEDRLKQLNIDLSAPIAPVANYVPTHLGRDGNLQVSGQIPFIDGHVAYKGILGQSISVEEAYDAARHCAINVLAQVNSAIDGDWDRIISCRKVTVFVAATPEFELHPKVGNGASDLLVEILGARGRHARSAIGVSSLPFHAPVEVEAIFEIAQS